jgi:hypothetical protein
MSPAQQIRLALQPLAHSVQLRGFAVTDGNNKVRPHESVDLAELNRLRLVPVTRRLEHHEDRVAVSFDLGPLVRRNGVLDR